MILAGGRAFPVDKVMSLVQQTDYTRVVVSKRELLQAIKRAAVAIKGDDSRRLQLLLEGKLLNCICESDSMGMSSSDVDCDSVDPEGLTRTVFLDVQALESAVNKIGSDTIVMLIGQEEDYLTLDCSPVWWTIAPFIKDHADGKDSVVDNSTK
jgi:hypothetical protein